MIHWIMSLFEMCHFSGAIKRGGLVFSVLDPARAVWVPTLPGSSVVTCSWARLIILTVPLSAQDYRWRSPVCLSAAWQDARVPWNRLLFYRGRVGEYSWVHGTETEVNHWHSPAIRRSFFIFFSEKKNFWSQVHTVTSKSPRFSNPIQCSEVKDD